MITLNKLSYMALSTKINNMKPTALRKLADDLVNEVYDNADHNPNRLQHYLYSLKAVVQIKQRLSEISKLTLKRSTINEYDYCLHQIKKQQNANTDLSEFVEAFFLFSNIFTYTIGKWEDLILANKFNQAVIDYAKSTGISSSLKVTLNLKVAGSYELTSILENELMSIWCSEHIEDCTLQFRELGVNSKSNLIDEFKQTIQLLDKREELLTQKAKK